MIVDKIYTTRRTSMYQFDYILTNFELIVNI